MSVPTSIFHANMDQLLAFSLSKQTHLTHTYNSTGKLFLHTVPGKASSRSQRETAQKVAHFLRKNRLKIEGSLNHERTLHHLAVSFPKELGPVCKELLQSTSLMVSAHFPGKNYSERQDVKILFTYQGREHSRWIHSHFLAQQHSELLRLLQLSPLKNGYHTLQLEGISPQTLDTALILLANTHAPLPPSPAFLCQIYHNGEQLEELTGLSSIKERAIQELNHCCKQEDIIPLCSSVKKWNSPLGHCVSELLAQHFLSTLHHPESSSIPLEAVAYALKSCELQVPESQVVTAILLWLEKLSSEHPEKKTPGELAQQPLIHKKRLVDFIHFEHLTLSEFAACTVPNALLPPEEIQQWLRWLASPNRNPSMPQRMPRTPFHTLTSSDSRQIRVWWRIPVKGHLEAPHSTHGVLPLEASPPFLLEPGQWRLVFSYLTYGPFLCTIKGQQLPSSTPPKVLSWNVHYPKSGEKEEGSQCIYPNHPLVDLKGSKSQWEKRVDPKTGEIFVDMVLKMNS